MSNSSNHSLTPPSTPARTVYEDDVTHDVIHDVIGARDDLAGADSNSKRYWLGTVQALRDGYIFNSPSTTLLAPPPSPSDLDHPEFYYLTDESDIDSNRAEVASVDAPTREDIAPIESPIKRSASFWDSDSMDDPVTPVKQERRRESFAGHTSLVKDRDIDSPFSVGQASVPRANADKLKHDPGADEDEKDYVPTDFLTPIADGNSSGTKPPSAASSSKKGKASITAAANDNKDFISTPSKAETDRRRAYAGIYASNTRPSTASWSSKKGKAPMTAADHGDEDYSPPDFKKGKAPMTATDHGDDDYSPTDFNTPASRRRWYTNKPWTGASGLQRGMFPSASPVAGPSSTFAKKRKVPIPTDYDEDEEYFKSDSKAARSLSATVAKKGEASNSSSRTGSYATNAITAAVTANKVRTLSAISSARPATPAKPLSAISSARPATPANPLNTTAFAGPSTTAKMAAIMTPRAGKTPNAAGTKTPATKSATPKTVRNTPRIRATPKAGKNAELKAIPRSFEECDEADKTLITMRDNGRQWAPIKAKYEEITGNTYGHSTLPNRYERLKRNFLTVKQEHNLKLLKAKNAIQAEYEASKWQMIADRVREADPEADYEPKTLQRHFKKLMSDHGFDVHLGLARFDPDFASTDEDGSGGEENGQAEHEE